MKNKKALVIAAGMALLSAAALGWAACNGVPDEDNNAGATLVLNVTSPRPAAPAAKDAVPMTVEKIDPAAARPDADPSGPIIPHPLSDTWALRVSLTNPNEAFLILNWVENTPVTLMVTPGSGRFLDVEAYLIYGSTPPSNQFPAYLYQTITPSAQRTLDLDEAAKTVAIELGPFTSTGNISGGVIYDYPFSSLMTAPVPAAAMPSTDAPLPLPGTVAPYCPDYNYNHTNITDPAFGLTFPSVYTPLWSGGPSGLVISGVPAGRPYNLTTFHTLSGIYAPNSVSVLAGGSVPPTAVDLHFTGYRDPTLSFSPPAFHPINAGDLGSVYVIASGGWGISSIDTSSSSCWINMVTGGNGVWLIEFQAPSMMTSCTIYVYGEDCGVPSWGPNPATGILTVPITGGGWGWP